MTVPYLFFFGHVNLNYGLTDIKYQPGCKKIKAVDDGRGLPRINSRKKSDFVEISKLPVKSTSNSEYFVFRVCERLTSMNSIHVYVYPLFFSGDARLSWPERQKQSEEGVRCCFHQGLYRIFVLVPGKKKNPHVCLSIEQLPSVDFGFL